VPESEIHDPSSTRSGEGREIRVTANLRTLLESQRAITDACQRQGEKACPRVLIRFFRANSESLFVLRPRRALAACPLSDLDRLIVQRDKRLGSFLVARAA